MKIALLAVTQKGKILAEKIRLVMPDSQTIQTEKGIRSALEQTWDDYDGIVCIMAAGIVVRCLSGLCRNKSSDPCIVVLDERGSYAISLLSGHIGGGNKLAEDIASICGGKAVITTASDVSGHTSVDLWSIENNLIVANPERLASTSAKLLNSGYLSIYQDREYISSFPYDFKPCLRSSQADIVISVSPGNNNTSLQFLPRIHYIGFGCRRGTTVEEFKEALEDLREKHGLDLRTVAGLASIDLKNDEKGLLELAILQKLPIQFYTKETLNDVGIPVTSLKVYEKIGAYGVCEPAAVQAATFLGKPGQLIIKKITWNKITAAVALRVN